MINSTTKNLLSFIKNSPSMFHSVFSIKKVLKREGFIELNEYDNYEIIAGGKYFVTRNDSSVIAFKVGNELDSYSFWH